MKKSMTFELEENIKVAEPYFMQAPEADAETSPYGPPYATISCYNDYVVIYRDTMTSTIQLACVSKLPTGIVVGIGPEIKSGVNLGDHVRFQDTMVLLKETDYPGYPVGSLVVVPDRAILFRLP